MRAVPSSRRIRSRCSLVVATLAALAMSGCGGDDGAINAPPSDPDDPAPAESVTRSSAPSQRSADLSAKLNLLREQTYRDVLANPANAGLSVRASHNDVLYTAAVRHAINLNTVNSYNATSNSTGGDMQVITPDSPLVAFSREYTLFTITEGEGGSSSSLGATGRAYPALFTSDLVWDRVLAVRGGPGHLRSRSESIASEYYVFSGNFIGSGGTSVFRGYNEDNIASPPDAVDNVWYTSRGRVALMRASLKAFGYGRKDDTYEGYRINPPHPILSNRFSGVMVTTHNAPLVSLKGNWPSNGANDVIPYGLDTDVGGPSGYAGPPIHFTLPFAEPLLLGADNLSIRIEKVGPQPLTRIPGTRKVRVYGAQTGQLASMPSDTDARRDFLFTGFSSSSVLVDDGLLDAITFDYRGTDGNILLSFASIPGAPSIFDVRPGDTVLVNVPDDPFTTDVNESILYAGPATVIANGTRPELGSIGDVVDFTRIPYNSLVVSAAWEPLDWTFRFDRATADVLANGVDRVVVDNRSADLGLRQGEFVIVPMDPLEPNSSYRVQVRARTIAEQFTFDFTFTTNGRSAPVP